VPQTLVPTESTASGVDAVVFGTLRDGNADSRPTATTACPPRLRRVAAFMSANRAIARVEDALADQDARPEVTDPGPRSPMRDPKAAPCAAALRVPPLSTAGNFLCRARRT